MFFFQALDFTSRNGLWYSWKNGPVLLSIFPQKMGSLETWSTEHLWEHLCWIPIFWGPNCGTGKDEDRSGRTGLDEEGVVGSFRNCLVKDSSRWKGFKRFQCNVLFFSRNIFLTLRLQVKKTVQQRMGRQQLLCRFCCYKRKYPWEKHYITFINNWLYNYKL